MKNILLISPEPWNAHSVSKHHYATTLAKQGKYVYFLNPPSPYNEEKKLKIQCIKENERLFIVSASRIAKGIRFYPSFYRSWLEKRWLRKFETLINKRIDAVWLFENSRFYDMRFAEDRLKIYHQVDLNQDYQPKIAAKTADISFCTSDVILRRLSKFSSKVYKIHHGLAITNVNHNLYAHKSHFSTQKINATYVGNLEIPYLDTELLSSIVFQFPNVKFNFIGGYKKSSRLYKLTAKLPNIHWWGRVESSLIPSIVENSDVLLVTYKAEEYRDQLSSPHKFMEYFASGKVIVSTYTDEYKDKQHLLEMVKYNKDYFSTFERVINNLSEYNSIERKNQRIEFAYKNTYEKQLKKIFSLIQKTKFGNI